jgi:cobalt-zinc-cadmium efflux system outer membrane protein
MFTPLRAAIVVAACLPSAAWAQAQPLTLEFAVRRTLDVTPHTASTTARTEGLASSRVAAGLRPQPSVDVQVENFGPPIGGLYDQFQITGSYSQRFERGGKREARVALVDRELGVVRAEAIVTRLDIIMVVQRLFLEVQAAEVSVQLARQRVEIAERVLAEVRRRVASAKDPLFAGMRAETALSEAKVDLDLAIRARDAALVRLTGLWGGSPEGFIVPIDSYFDLDQPLGPGLPSRADLAVYEARGAQADAGVDLARANAVRDPTFSAGPRFIGTGDVGLVAGVSFPLGGRRLANARVGEAQAERRRVDADMNVERVARERAITLAMQRVEQARQEAIAIRDRVIPTAELTLDEVRVGYNRGFFSFTDVHVAQTTLANARTRMADAVRRYHEARIEFDRLTGRFADLAEENFQ